MNAKPLDEARDQDLRNVLPALKRAVQRARQVAVQTQTAMIVVRHGKIVREKPQLDHQGQS